MSLDYKHTIYHVLTGLYFIWFILFTILTAMALYNHFNAFNPGLGEMLLSLMVLNLVMGTILFGVLRLYRNQGRLGKIIAYSFAFITGTAVTTILRIR